MFPASDDILAYIASFLGGASCQNLSFVSKSFYQSKYLKYDGPRRTTTSHVCVFPEDYKKWCTRSRNGYLFSVCYVPPFDSEQVSQDWIRQLANNPDVDPCTFICAWMFLRDYELLDLVVHDIGETMTSTQDDPQITKLLYLLDRYCPCIVSLDYVLRLSCLQQNLDLVVYLLKRFRCEITVSVLMMALVSSDFNNTRQQLVQILMGYSRDISILFQLDFWAIKYPLYSDDMETFKLLYSYLLQEGIILPEYEICQTLPENRRLGVFKEITQFRQSFEKKPTECVRLKY